MNRRFFPTIAFTLLLIPRVVSGQADTARLSLSECIQLALKNSPLAEMARSTYDSKRSSYRSFMAGYYPQLSLQGVVPNYSRSINPITLPDGSSVFTPQSQANSSLIVSLSQKIPWTGGELSLSSALNRIDLIEPHSQYYRSTPFTMFLNQPLFRINTMWWDRETQDLTNALSSREFVQSMEESASDLVDRFFALVLADINVTNAGRNLAVNDTLYQISRGRYNVGRIAENDLLQSELAFLKSQTQRENALVDLERAGNNLRLVIGLDPGTVVQLIPPTEIPVTAIDANDALSRALHNSSNIVSYRLQRLTAERNVAQARSDHSFSATVTASVGYNQRAPILRDAYRSLLDAQQFNLGFSVPILSWGAGSEAVESALSEQKRTETSVEKARFDLTQEVLYQTARLNLLARQVSVAAKADTIARRRFDVAKQRYLIGKIAIPDLFQAQNEKDDALGQNLQTLWDYWRTYYRIRTLTLYDFAEGRSLIEEGPD
jgi:outer membrane protein TolC